MNSRDAAYEESVKALIAATALTSVLWRSLFVPVLYLSLPAWPSPSLAKSSISMLTLPLESSEQHHWHFE